MNGADLLRSLWPKAKIDRRANAKRSKDLLVDRVDYAGLTGTVETSDWVYDIPYGMLQALDIQLMVRFVKGIETLAWMQGPYLAFAIGDIVHTRDGCQFVQVTRALPMVPLAILLTAA